MWLALWVGKMNQIMCCDWLSKWARWSDTACLQLPVAKQYEAVECHIINALLTKLQFSQDSWILASFSFCIFRALTSSQSIQNAKENLTNIQPSWPRTWSIIHMYDNLVPWNALFWASWTSRLLFRCNWIPEYCLSSRRKVQKDKKVNL